MRTKHKAQNTKHKTRIGVDTGGTFTDFVFEKDHKLHLFKLPSTPSDPSQSITDGLKRICKDLGVNLRDVEVVHGTTVGTNALLQRRGARTALVTTKGFEDVLIIGRQARPELYNLNAIKLPSLVADELRFGVAERREAAGFGSAARVRRRHGAAGRCRREPRAADGGHRRALVAVTVADRLGVLVRGAGGAGDHPRPHPPAGAAGHDAPGHEPADAAGDSDADTDAAADVEPAADEPAADVAHAHAADIPDRSRPRMIRSGGFRYVTPS